MIDVAIELHGHLAPGLALGMRMSEIAMEGMNLKKGNKKAIGISETSRCLADGMQVVTGCTLGHGNAFVQNYGKLALTVGRVDSMEGIRVALKEDAWSLSLLMKKWMMREGKLKKDEEVDLSHDLLKLDESYFDIEPVRITMQQLFENSKIVKCSVCGDLVPEALATGVMCKMCAGESYFQPAEVAVCQP